MVWATPNYPRSKVNIAGRSLVKGSPDVDINNILLYFEEREEYNKNIEIVNNWRSSHSYPLNTFQATLRKRGKK